jgi:hypothetical protein
MQRCTYCEYELPLNVRFCGRCGRLLDPTTAPDEVTARSNQHQEERAIPPAGAFAQPQAPSFQFAQTETTPPPPPHYQTQMPPRFEPVPGSSRPPQHTPAIAPKVLGGSATKWIITAVATIVVLGAGGAGLAAYLLTRPQAVIGVTSKYTVGTTPAGSTGTVLHISGQKFSGNSAITFLLDGTPVPGNPTVPSDANGTVRADLLITSGWSVGNHTLTARDASGHSTKNSLAVVIVPQGEANTPGPLGAPADDTNFTLNISIHAQIQPSGGPFSPQETGKISGHPDPAGGTVCQPADNGQPQVYSDVTLNTGIPYRETATYSCGGTYKAGKLNYTETLTSDTIVFAPNGVSSTCTLIGPRVSQQLNGSYTGNHTFSGTVTFLAIPTSSYTCQHGNYFFHYGAQGTWTGQIAGS